MSNDTPGQSGVDYLGDDPQPGRSGGRRWGVIAAATVGVLGIAGAGAWGVTMLNGGGPGAATAVPEDALAYVALDLDPDAGQKLEAYQLMQKFPALKDKIGSDSEDLRKTLVEALLDEAPCDDLTYADDFEPWLGDRIAVAAVPGDGEPVPVGVVQVKDEDKARAGIEAMVSCGDSGEMPGLAFVGDYMVLGETEAIAAELAKDAEAGSLADSDSYNRWVDEAGGRGIVTGYLSADAPMAFLDAAEAADADFATGSDSEGMPAPDTDAESNPLVGPDGEEAQKQLEKAFAEFEGGAMVLRVDDGALELEAAMSNVGGTEAGEGSDSGITELPASTVVALGFGVADGSVQEALDQLAESLGQKEYDQVISELEAQTGLSVPEDVEALLGDGVSLAVDSSIDVNAIVDADTGMLNVPVGLRISGNPDEIVPILEKIASSAGVTGQMVIEEGDGVVAVGVTQEYVANLAADGDLGEQESFTKALPNLDDSAGGLFVDFDTDDWLAKLLEGDNTPAEVQENVEPLDSLGISGSTDGDVAHVSVRLSTD